MKPFLWAKIRASTSGESEDTLLRTAPIPFGPGPDILKWIGHFLPGEDPYDQGKETNAQFSKDVDLTPPSERYLEPMTRFCPSFKKWAHHVGEKQGGMLPVSSTWTETSLPF